MLWEWFLKTNRTFESCSCPFSLERPVSRKAGKTKTKYSVLHVHKKWGFIDTFQQKTVPEIYLHLQDWKQSKLSKAVKSSGALVQRKQLYGRSTCIRNKCNNYRDLFCAKNIWSDCIQSLDFTVIKIEMTVLFKPVSGLSVWRKDKKITRKRGEPVH